MSDEMVRASDRTLEELEGQVWSEPEEATYLATTCYELRKKPLGMFTVEDLRIMLSQNLGVAYLLPQALVLLESQSLVEGDCYPGDLLSAATKLPSEYWIRCPEHLYRLRHVVKDALEQLKNEKEPYPSEQDLRERLSGFLEATRQTG